MVKKLPKASDGNLRPREKAVPSSASRAAPPTLGRRATGTDNASLQTRLINQVLSAAWLEKGGNQDEAVHAILGALAAIAPADGLEGMLATRMVATHKAALECLRRGMISEQTFAGRDVNLKHAAKLSQIYARQMEALGKHRNRGQQRITVEHVNVHAGGQAIVGNVQAPVAKSGVAPSAGGTLSGQRAARVDLTDLTGASTGAAKAQVRRREQ